VDDPYAFGQIAVANALSDVYAMGGEPLTAMNLVCFPKDSMDISVLESILRGGLDKMHEAGVTLVGGHSIDDPELKYGLSVTGKVHPDRLVTNAGAKAGDKLILTKPLGMGIISTALKGGLVDDELAEKVTNCMTALNKKASELMQEIASQVGLEFQLDAIPYFAEVVEFSRQGLCPGGLVRNREYYSCKVEITEEIPEHVRDVFYDPQTSGGLLICLEAEKADILLGRLKEAGVAEAAIIGGVVSEPKGKVVLR